MNTRTLSFALLSSAALIVTSACSDDETGAATGGSGGMGASGATGGTGGMGAQGGGGADTSTVSLTLDGLEPLGDGFVYEGWLIVDDVPVSAGRFNIVDGTDTYTAMVSADDAAMAAAYVLTIEPDPDDDAGPSAVHVLGGDLSGGGADLTIDHAAALGTDLSAAVGSYILNTPSTGSDDSDFDQGIWWLEVTPNGPVASLTLPTLPAGWVYEGWVAGASGPVSTGRFSAAEGEDMDGKGPTAGPDGFPPFPGQDFITPAIVLTGGFAAVISVEPDPDDSAAPFAIKPLIDMDIEDVGIGVTQTMDNMSANNPAGSVTISTP